MNNGSAKFFTTGALLLAALACYADLPRLNLVLNLGDTLNAVRVRDIATHIAMARKAATADTDAENLRDDLDDGRRSLALIGESRSPDAVTTAFPGYRPPSLAACDHPPRGMTTSLKPVALSWPPAKPRPPSDAWYRPDSARPSALCLRGPPRMLGL